MITPMTHSYELPPVWAPHVHRVFLEPRELQRLQKTIQIIRLRLIHSFDFRVVARPKSYTQNSWCGSLLDIITSLAPWVVVVVNSQVVQATLRWMIL